MSSRDAEKECPHEIQLEEVEFLRLENSQMKVGIAMREVERLQKEHSSLARQVEERLEIDALANYAINPKTYTGNRVPKAEGPTDVKA